MSSGVQDGMKSLRGAIDDHFSSQHEELKKLREEIDGLSRGALAFSLFSWSSWKWHSNPMSEYRWTPSQDRDWNDERLQDFHRDVSNGSALLSTEIIALTTKVEKLKQKKDNLRDICGWTIYCLALLTIILSPAISAGS